MLKPLDPHTAPPNTEESVGTEVETALEDYHKAFEQEFARADKATSKAYINVKDTFTTNASDIAIEMLFLAKNARSELTRLNAQKYIIDFVKDIEQGTGGDPFKDLMGFLTNNNNSPDAESDT